MEPVIAVECLRCGLPRAVRGSLVHAMGAGHCPRCGYVGWAHSEGLSEETRRALREVPVEFRRRATPRLVHT
jgi:hypothetical protein